MAVSHRAAASSSSASQPTEQDGASRVDLTKARVCCTCGAPGSLNEPLEPCEECAHWLHFGCCEWFTPGSTPVCCHCSQHNLSHRSCEKGEEIAQQDVNDQSHRPPKSNAKDPEVYKAVIFDDPPLISRERVEDCKHCPSA